MPALITHRLFGEESIERLPEGIITNEDERAAFLLANQGPDPFFFRFRTPNMGTCMELSRVMHRSRMSRQFAALREGVSRLQPSDSGVGRAWTLGMLSHYVLDRNAHPFVYAQQWGIQEADPDLTGAGSQVHAVIESDLDLLVLQLKRNGRHHRRIPARGRGLQQSAHRQGRRSARELHGKERLRHGCCRQRIRRGRGGHAARLPPDRTRGSMRSGWCSVASRAW